MVHHVVFTYRIPAELAETAVALLWSEGCEGLQELDEDEAAVRLEAYFPAGHAEVRLPLEGAELVSRRDLVEEDWLESYRRQAQPLEIGERLLVDPREPDEPRAEPAAGRTLLRVPARQAFGTGSHESTRLILELMESAPLAGARVLDAGSGSGILSFAALALGARSVTGFDFDLPSALLAGEYRRLNRPALGGIAPSFFAGRLDALEAPEAFDVLLINILPERILPELPRLARLAAPAGEVLLSGILQERGEEMVAAWGGCGFRPQAQRTAGEWIAYRCRR